MIREMVWDSHGDCVAGKVLFDMVVGHKKVAMSYTMNPELVESKEGCKNSNRQAGLNNFIKYTNFLWGRVYTTLLVLCADIIYRIQKSIIVRIE